jgi:predicted  nucleic acid-binding Zn-ribbon protein
MMVLSTVILLTLELNEARGEKTKAEEAMNSRIVDSDVERGRLTDRVKELDNRKSNATKLILELKELNLEKTDGKEKIVSLEERVAKLNEGILD